MRTEREIQRAAEGPADVPAQVPTEEERAPKPMPGLGLIKGLMVTLRTLLKRSVTQQYPREKPELPPRSRGVIALKQENCTVCYKCSRECPDWCIYIDAHKETHEPAGGGRGRSIKVLDRFDIDYALCMYCGICVEVCPFDALFWTPEFEYSEFRIESLLHDKEKLQEWTYTVLPPPELEAGAEVPEELAGTQMGQTEPVPAAAQPQPAKAEAVAAPQEAPTTQPAVPAPTRGDEAQGAPTPAPTATQPKERAPRVEVEPDQETFDRVLQEQLDKGVDKRVAEGRARSAAILTARKKAQGG